MESTTTTSAGVTYDENTIGSSKADIIDQYGVWRWNGSQYVLLASAGGVEVGTDDISGNNVNDRVFGGAGSDIIYGGKGSDYLQGDAGDDILYGDRQVVRTSFTTGSTTTAAETDALDEHEFTGSEAGNDILDGGSGNDKLYGKSVV